MCLFHFSCRYHSSFISYTTYVLQYTCKQLTKALEPKRPALTSHNIICILQCRPTQQCILKALTLLRDLKEIHKSLPEGASLEGDTKEKVEGIKVRLCSQLCTLHTLL